MNNLSSISSTLLNPLKAWKHEQENGIQKLLNNEFLLTRLPMRWIHFRLKLTLLKLLIQSYRNPIDWVRGLFFLIKLRRRFLGDFQLKKMVKVDSKFYMGLFTPGWKDETYERFILSELNRFKPTRIKSLRFNHVYLAITKKCPLQCEHCYTWDLLNKREFFSEETLKKVIHRLQDIGTGQIQLTGGEPLLKTDLIIKLLESSWEGTNFWINTSGFKLTHEKAKRLKQAGLTGVIISLDHYDEEAHNSFRNYRDAYFWAVNGAKNAKAHDLVVAFSICLRNEFVQEGHLEHYMDFAKDMGVHFVQFLDPRAVGNYSDTAEPLQEEILKQVESLYEKANFSNKYLKYPIISYPGYYQRRQGCFAGGDRGMYIDPEGDLNACPFCHNKIGNVLEDNLEGKLDQLKNMGCPTY